MTLIQLLALLIFVGVNLKCLDAQVRQQLRSIDGLSYRFFGSAVLLCCLWHLQVGIIDGLKTHFLLLTALTLTMGPRVAVLSGSLALCLLALFGHQTWESLGTSGLLDVLLPISVSYLVYAISYHKLPRHFAVYVFLCSFLGAAFTLVIFICVSAGVFWLSGTHDWATIETNYLVIAVLMWFPEALINGMLMTLMIVYRPEWVYTFYDSEYLDK